MAATSEVGIHHIQHQIDNCDTIVANIDKIVPKIYKIRQQALAQKEYINDIQKILLSSGFSAIDGTTKVATLATSALGNAIVGDTWKDAIFKAHTNSTIQGTDEEDLNTLEQRQVFQSLFKFKHEIGTLNHFTSEQIGTEGDRTRGLNLSDVVEITTGLDSYLSASNSLPVIPGASTHIDKLIKKESAVPKVNPMGGSDLFLVKSSAASSTNYTEDANNGIASILDQVITITDQKIIGFGLS